MPFDPISPVPTVEVPALRSLEAGIARITNERDWCKNFLHTTQRGWFGRQRHQYCAIGSVAQEFVDLKPGGISRAKLENNRFPALDLTIAAMNKAVERRGYFDVADFNNSPAVTHSEVLAVMREAAEIIRSGQV
jgi:hypothetical protein